MTDKFDYAKRVGSLSPDQRLTFYEFLAHELTIVVRLTWTDEALSDRAKVDRMKVLNELMHRVTAKIHVLRTGSHEWSEEDFAGTVDELADSEVGIRDRIESAIQRCYRLVREGMSGVTGHA